MVALRLAIGWHFFVEGYQKIQSHSLKGVEGQRPWTAEGYFRVAEGPIRGMVIKMIGDPDQEMLENLRPLSSGEGEKSARVPPSVAEMWDGYMTNFAGFYKLNNDEKEVAKEKVKKVKEQYVDFLSGGEQSIKRTSPNSGNSTSEVKITVPERVAEYEFRLRELRTALESKNTSVGRDADKTVPKLRGDIASMRAEFQAEIDRFSINLKDDLASMLKGRFVGFNVKSNDPDVDNRLLRMLKPRSQDVTYGSEENAMPALLGEQWDTFLAYAKEFHPSLDDAEATRKLTESKRRYVRFLLDRDEFSGTPSPTATVARRLKDYEEAEANLAKLMEGVKSEKELPAEKKPLVDAQKSELKAIRDSFIADIQRHTEVMKSYAADGVPAETLKGYIKEEKKQTTLQLSDKITMWVICVSGACLMLGFFTRLACLVAGGFLVMTYLLHPPFPWLPASPMNEGNYLFINKNVIEALALFMLATTRSGRWFGIDALISAIFGRKKKSD
jgi:uncharacterized membrane protein YphA (DoxX/SURF4 family)